jgi:hypothetical protein
MERPRRERYYLMTVATVEIRRSAAGYRDRWRRYRVLIDGAEVGRLRRGEARSFDVGPGSHRVRVAIDWKKSAEHAVDGGSHGTFRFRCGPTRGPLWATLDIFKRGDNSWLSFAPDDS